jgi:hypothetical protein
MIEDDPGFLAEQAARCWRLSRGSNDPRLLELGREFTEWALKSGADPDDLPEEWVMKRAAKNAAA